MKPSQPMQVISHRLTSPRAPSTPPQSEHAPDKVDGKTPGSLSSREESAGTPTAREERRKAERECGKDYESCVLIKTERECGKDCEATGFTHSVLCFNEYSYIYIYQIAIFEEILLSQISLLFQLLYLKKLFLLTEKFG